MYTPLTHYRRSETSPWVAIPRTTRNALRRFLAVGTWHSVMDQNGKVSHKGAEA